MPRVMVTTRSGDVRTLNAELDRTVMEVIRENGVDDLLALCGGACSCATCHVYVDASFKDRLPPMSEDEDGLLDGAAQRNTTSRLSCQLRVTEALDGLRVTIAPED